MASFIANGLLDLTIPLLSESSDTPGYCRNNDYTSPLLQVTSAGQDKGREQENGTSGLMSFKPTGLLNQDPPEESPLLVEYASYESAVCEGSSFGLGRKPRKKSFADFATGFPMDTYEGFTSLSTEKCIEARTFDGKIICLKRKAKERKTNQNKHTMVSSRTIGKLLDVPIHRLLDNLSACVQEDRDQEPIAVTHIEGSDQCSLWVDLYRPTRFTELLGNERVARETLAWIKQWDWCVFGRRPKAKRKIIQEDDLLDSLDEFRRPLQKILLLSGPPGLGKTTLAHVVARQAGYEVLEINASDARTGSVVEDRIRPALESGSAVGKQKPVLLVIDEIDGATGAGENSFSFINKLVQLVLHKPKRKRGASGPHARPPVLRPIVCICNDANTSVLTRLRPHTYHLRYARPADTHIVNRLRYICETECLSVESRALSTLVSAARGDLRGCLNALQFLKSRNVHVTEATVRRATNGMKEADVSLNVILTNLFSPLSKKRRQELDLTEEDESRYVSRLSREIESSGRESALAVGCFTQYPNMRQHDANFSRYEKANEWLITYDVFSSAMYSDGEFALLQYLPYTLVPFHPLFSQRGTQVERSQTDWDHLQLTRTNEEIYKSMSRGLRNSSASSEYRHLLTSPTLELEFAPYINRIISPPIRPINSQIVRAEERAVLTRLVDIMVSLDLRFLQERAEDGQLTYRLDPPVDVFITYDGKRATDIAVSRYAVRQLVANEVDARVSARDIDSGKSDNLHSTKKLGTNTDVTLEPPNKRARIAAEAVPVDFFGRPIVRSQTDQPKKAKIEKVRVTYRFTEGNSAAVRKPVKVGTFL